MSNLITNPMTNDAGATTTERRAQIVAEAVLSAYIHEIASGSRRREHAVARRRREESARTPAPAPAWARA